MATCNRSTSNKSNVYFEAVDPDWHRVRKVAHQARGRLEGGLTYFFPKWRLPFALRLLLRPSAVTCPDNLVYGNCAERIGFCAPVLLGTISLAAITGRLLIFYARWAKWQTTKL
jgi:hypothetical protein